MAKRGITFSGSNFQFKFKRTEFSDNMQKLLTTAIKQSARAFLREAIIRTPVKTGTARGSLRPLSRFLRFPTVPISPTVKQKGKGISEGEALGGPATPITVTSTKVTFTYSTKVFHYVLNDRPPPRNYTNGQRPTPWLAFDMGFKKLQEEFDKQIKKKFPSVLDYITSGEVS